MNVLERLLEDDLVGVRFAVNVFIGTTALWLLLRLAAETNPIWAIASMIAAADPQLTLHGLFAGEGIEEVIADATDAVRDAIEALPRRQREDDAAVREAARIAVRRAIQASHGKRPPTEIHLVRL